MVIDSGFGMFLTHEHVALCPCDRHTVFSASFVDDSVSNRVIDVGDVRRVIKQSHLHRRACATHDGIVPRQSFFVVPQSEMSNSCTSMQLHTRD